MSKKLSKKTIVNLCCILLILITMIFGYIILSRDNTKVQGEPVITFSTDNPDESKDNANNYNWRGGPEDPKKINIPRIDVSSYVQQAGVDQNNKVAVPSNVHLAGWFIDSSRPGQKGLSIIAGHVSGRATDGVFKRLGELGKGDNFNVELGNGDIKNYEVLTKEQVKESESANLLFNQNPKIASQLNLITCGGEYDRGSNQYSDRVIITAKLL